MAADLKEFKALKLSPGEGVSEVLCAQGKASLSGLFGVFKLADGTFAACWEAHYQKCDCLEDLKDYLNQYEKTLLQFGVKE